MDTQFPLIIPTHIKSHTLTHKCALKFARKHSMLNTDKMPENTL